MEYGAWIKLDYKIPSVSKIDVSVAYSLSNFIGKSKKSFIEISNVLQISF
jgi:hypothetical protein